MNENEDKRLVFTMEELCPLIIETSSLGGSFPVKVKGVSMLPFLKEGRDTAYFSSLEGRKIRRGDIVLFKRRNGQYVMHRVYKTYGSSFDFVGDNQHTVEPGIERENLVAYVALVIRNGKKISCEKGMWRFVMTAYMLFRVKFPRLTASIIRAAKRMTTILKCRG